MYVYLNYYFESLDFKLKNSFPISYKANLIAINLSVYLFSGKVFFLSFILKESLTGDNILDWIYFFLSLAQYICNFTDFCTPFFSDKKLAVIIIGVFIYLN